MDEESNYEKYRGKCKEFSVDACAEDSTLTLVRGHFRCPITDKREPHWWTTRPDGSIYDPTQKQFVYWTDDPKNYEPYDGTCRCKICDKVTLEEDTCFYGKNTFCSGECYDQFCQL